MSWLFTPAQAGVSVSTINPLPHQRRIDATGVNIPFNNYSVATGPDGRTSHVLSSIGEVQLRHEGLGAVLTTVGLPAITSNAPFADGVGRTRASAFIRLSDAHEARLKCMHGFLNPGHTVPGDYLELALVVNGTEVKRRKIASMPLFGGGFSAWYVIDSGGTIHFCCGAWAINPQIAPFPGGRSLPAPTFGPGTFILAQPVDHADVFVGLPRFGTFCDQTNFTGSGGGSFFVAAKSGLLSHARHATPDPPDAILARAGQGLASLRQDLSNFAQPLVAHSNTTGNVAYGQGIINIDNGGHPEYPAGRIGQFVVASHAYTTGEMGYLPRGVSNIGNSWEENQRLSQLEVRVVYLAIGSDDYFNLGRPVSLDAACGFNEYQGSLVYQRTTGQMWACVVDAFIDRVDVVLPNNATGFTGVTASADFFVRAIGRLGPTGPSGMSAIEDTFEVTHALTPAQQADLLSGSETIVPVRRLSGSLVSGLDMLMRAVGPTGATAP